jgi:response regulator RpfG family c-di-GMP phosphodiesterase
MTWSKTGYQGKGAQALPRVLLVDDEPAILDGLRRQLRGTFDVSTAVGGEAALELMEGAEPFAAVLSDMRMPGMDGAAYLARVRELYPDTVRLLLTGQADMQSTIAAINEGQIYRFLTKPCPADGVVTALRDGVALHQQITAERDVLERTLRGAVQALLDALSMASPKGFSRALRVSQLVAELAEAAGVPLDWELEVSGMLAQVGAVTVPTSVLEKLDSGLLLTEEEQEMMDAVPGVTEQLVAGIPRLEGLAAAIGWQGLRYDGKGRRKDAPVGDDIPLAARFLRLAVDIDRMRSQRLPISAVRKRLADDGGAYDPKILELWGQSQTVDAAEPEFMPVALEIEDLKTGMVLAEDVLNSQGVVLLGRGSSVTEALLLRLDNHAKHGDVSGPVVVNVQVPSSANRSN